MANRYLLGAAGLALLAATGAAHATGPVAPADGAQIAVQVDKTLNTWFQAGFPPPDFWSATGAVIDFQNPAGWGFQIMGDAGFDIGLPIAGGWGGHLRAYRTFGNVTIGPYFLIHGSIPPGHYLDVGAGWDLEYRGGNFTVWNDNWFDFDGTFSLSNQILIQYAVTDQVKVETGMYVEFDGGGVFFDFEGAVRLELGGFTPFVSAYWSPSGAWGNVVAGVDFEHALGTGPFSLIGNAQIALQTGVGLTGGASIGIRYGQGTVNTPRWWDDNYP